MSAARLADEVAAAALAGLPGIGPATLAAALAGATPADAWQAVVDGRLARPVRRAAGRPGAGRPVAGGPAGGDDTTPTGTSRSDPVLKEACGITLPFDGAGVGPVPAADTARSWQAAARGTDLDRVAARLRSAAIGVTWVGDSRYPAALRDDPEQPGVLFWRGDPSVLEGPCVALVGTRHCSPDGRQVAFELGRDLADAGVCVVSGLALGIDGAAHRGALSAGAGSTVGVAASGVDVAYPRRHAGLWEDTVANGAVVSETAPGHPAQAWRFPARNRIIAGLVRMVVVVESHEAGGSMLTVDAALRRGVEVGAVPGPVHSPASRGTNRLLYDGAPPVRHAGDVLDALGLTAGRLGVRPGRTGPAAPFRGADRAEASLSAEQRRVHDALGWAPTGFGRILERGGVSIGATGQALARLEELGLVERGSGWWVRHESPP